MERPRRKVQTSAYCQASTGWTRIILKVWIEERMWLVWSFNRENEWKSEEWMVLAFPNSYFWPVAVRWGEGGDVRRSRVSLSHTKYLCWSSSDQNNLINISKFSDRGLNGRVLCDHSSQSWLERPCHRIIFTGLFERTFHRIVLYLLAPPSGALVVSQFQDPVQSIHPVPTYSFGCSNLP